MRAVLDADVLVSAVLSSSGAPAQLIQRWLGGEIEVVVCPLLIAELERALAYPKLSDRIAADQANRLVELVRELGDLVADPTEPPPVASSDPEDDYLVALGARERVPIVSGDDHLLTLAGRIPVFTPREFLEQLS